MKERPIIFSAPMVRALLEGRKTQTRRIIKQSPIASGPKWNVWYDEKCDCQLNDSAFITLHCPYGTSGQLLWVRETFYCDHLLFGTPRMKDGNAPIDEMRKMLYYRADVPDGRFENADDWSEPGSHWKPSIFMPRWASRITLEITGIRVERVQDISNRDAIAEGVGVIANEHPELNQAAHIYRILWNKINGNWNENPWVFVIEFRPVEKEPSQ